MFSHVDRQHGTHTKRLQRTQLSPASHNLLGSGQRRLLEASVSCYEIEMPSGHHSLRVWLTGTQNTHALYRPFMEEVQMTNKHEI